MPSKQHRAICESRLRGMLTASCALVVALHGSLLFPRQCHAEEPLDSAMYRDPQILLPRVEYKLPDRLPGLWIEALGRPDASLKSKAAQTITQAHEQGFPGMEAAVEALTRELSRPDQHALTRLAVTKAMIVLDAKGTAAELAKAAAADKELRGMVDPALARWDYKPARAEWLERLNQSPKTRGMQLAIQSLATVREEKAVPRLRELALDRSVPSSIRLEAARALGNIRRSAGEKDAQELVGDATSKGMVDRLIAASLLRHHEGEQAIGQLQSLAGDAEPAVAAVALTRLVEIDVKLVVPMLETVLRSTDANVRGIGIDVLFRLPTDSHLKLLADRMNDPHPGLRARARKAMIELAANAEWKEIVIREATRVLGGNDWRGLEQATFVLAQLDHKPSAQRLLVLLAHDRPEALVAAAWGLRKLAVEKTLQPCLEFLNSRYQVMLTPGPAATKLSEKADAVDLQLSHLCQFLGLGRYTAADKSLRRLIPPPHGKPANPAGFETRAAAVWALGLIHEGKPVPAVVGPVSGRLSAVNPFDVEDPRVRQMSAITLGRMMAVDEVDTVRRFYVSKMPTLDVVNNACGWALERLAGEKMPALKPIIVFRRDWFLTPLD